jgi:hypothetical protein
MAGVPTAGYGGGLFGKAFVSLRVYGRQDTESPVGLGDLWHVE